MKKYFIVVISMTLTIILVGCDLVVRYTREEIRVARQNMSNFLINISEASYQFGSAALISFRTSSPRVDTRVDRNEGFRVVSRGEGGILLCYYEDGILYLQGSASPTDISELYFLHEIEIRLRNLGRIMFDERYISDFRNATRRPAEGREVEVKRFEYTFDVQTVNMDNIFETDYDHIWMFIHICHTSGEMVEMGVRFAFGGLGRGYGKTYYLRTDLFFEKRQEFAILPFPSEYELAQFEPAVTY